MDNGQQLAPRALRSLDGVGDRLRTAAFAEVQAQAAFLWAADHYDDASVELKACWRELASQEQRHATWLLGRLAELGLEIPARPVHNVLWLSLMRCKSARDFCHYMAGAEERGRKAAERFREALRAFDPVTAEIFGNIAAEEVAHIAAAFRFFPQ